MGNGRTFAKVAAVAVAAVLVGLFAWGRLQPVYPAEVLASFVRDARWSEGRTALDLPWRPYVDDEKVADYTQVLVALYRKEPSAERELKLAMAQLYLWRAETGDFQRAEDHVAAFPEDAEALNEHALVLLAWGKPIEALNTVLGALDLAPQLPAALFTRAVLLERLSLDGEAVAAWQEFLAVESQGPWAVEARGRLAALQNREAPPVALEQELTDFARRLRELASAAELEAFLAEPATSQLLQTYAERGEHIFPAEVRYLQHLDASGWAERQAHAVAYGEERERVLAGLPDSGRLDRLGRTLDPLLALNARRLALYDAVQRMDLKQARRLRDEIELLCRTHGCLEPAVLASSDLASLLHFSGRFHEAEEVLARAEQQLAPLSARRAEVLTKQAKMAATTGALERASALAAIAIKVAHDERDEFALASALVNLGWYSAERGMPAVGVLYAREARSVAERAGVIRVVQLANANQAEALLARGRLAEASELLENVLANANETAMINVLQGNRLLLAQIRLRQGRNQETVALARSFIDQATSFAIRQEQIPSAGALEANAYFALGDAEGGVAALGAAARAAQRLVGLAGTPLEAERAASENASILAAYAARLAELGDPAAAWPLFGGGAPRELAVDECFVAQLRLVDGWGEWVADSRGTRFRQLAAPQSPLAEGGCAATTTRLTILDRPGADAPGLSRLVREASSHVAVVASRDLARQWPDGGVAGKALVVHSPQPVRLDLGLGFLPAAPREAAVVMRAYPGSRELRDGAATPEAVAALAAQKSLLHFAIHGVSGKASGSASFLLLGGELGHLEVVDILALPLKEKRPVVVLTACRSGNEEGAVEHNGGGLTWAFREAGARAVIAYQDNLEDAAALLFSESFYAALSEGAGLSAAFERGVARVREERSTAVAAAFILAI